MKTRFKTTALLTLLTLGSVLPAHADTVKGRVTRIYPLSNGVVNVSVAAGCKVGTSFYWQFTINSDVTKAWYTMLLTAAANKTPVAIAFPGLCDPANHQPIQYIYQDF